MAVTGGLGLTTFAAWAADSAPQGLQAVQYWSQHYLIRVIDPRKQDLRIYWKDDQGSGLKDFVTLEKFVSSQGERLVFAANAGMFQPDAKPVGLLVQDGVEQSPLNLSDGTGNFYLKPNGVFVINSKHEAHVMESSNYTALLSPAKWAAQSGPLMVNEAEIHPDFIEDSANKKIRSGVGIRRDGMIIFALSAEPVNFYHFASFFLSGLKCPNALYLDGEISAFYVPGMKETVAHSFGSIFGLVDK